MFKKHLEPTDFADSDCRVTDWLGHGDWHGKEMRYRIWVCKVGKGHWFQRHEWWETGKNSTEVQDWIYSGYHPSRQFEEGDMPAPDLA